MESNDQQLVKSPNPQSAPEEHIVSDEANSFRAPPYWHDDGDIILRVEDEKDTQRRDFRIHRLMLCLHSSVFRDMFSLGKNAVVLKENEIPTVPIQGDSVDDVRELLKMLYKGHEVCSGAETITFEGALGVLRLSHKYQMEPLKKCVLLLLRRSWPLDYKEYKTVLSSLTDEQKNDRIGKSIKLINTARLTACNELLPAAFFELINANWGEWTLKASDESLCLEDWTRLMHGKSLWAFRLRMLESAGILKNYNAYVWNKENKNSEDKISIFKTRVQFNACQNTKSVRQEHVDYCLAAFKCLKGLLGRKVFDGYSVVDGCKNWAPETFQAENVCEGCAKWMDSLMKNKEIEIWDNIVADFNLPKVDVSGYKTTSPRLL